MTRPAVIIWEALKNAFKRKKATIDYPFEEGIKPKKGLRGMHKFYIEKCTGCSRCMRVCPAIAIEMVPSEITRTKKRPVIDLGQCIFCGLCEENCPQDCLILTDTIELHAFEQDAMVIYQKEDPSKVKKKEEDKPKEDS